MTHAHHSNLVTQPALVRILAVTAQAWGLAVLAKYQSFKPLAHVK